jgi:hypothetical protein
MKMEANKLNTNRLNKKKNIVGSADRRGRKREGKKG